MTREGRKKVQKSGYRTAGGRCEPGETGSTKEHSPENLQQDSKITDMGKEKQRPTASERNEANCKKE